MAYSVSQKILHRYKFLNFINQKLKILKPYFTRMFGV